MDLGDDVVLRYITRDGRPGMSWAAKLARDDPDLLALWHPKGSSHKRWAKTASGRELVDAPWWSDTLRLMYPGRGHSIWLTWKDGAFQGYYVNLEEPFRRTPIGFDTNDHQLDVVVAPDLSWKLKDEDVIVMLEREGSVSHEFVAELRAEAERVVAAIERRDAPFDGSWLAWHAPAEWSVPVLHARWNVEPPVLWDRRLWAYTRPRDRAASESG